MTKKKTEMSHPVAITVRLCLWEIIGYEKIEQSSILTSARDWKVSIDMGGRLKIPVEISVTNLGPDITIILKETKQLILIDLAVPAEILLNYPCS